MFPSKFPDFCIGAGLFVFELVYKCEHHFIRFGHMLIEFTDLLFEGGLFVAEFFDLLRLLIVSTVRLRWQSA